MKIEVRRIWKKPAYTIGRMSIDGKYFCDTLEDTDRGLTKMMSIAQIRHVKVQGKTAIPAGSYSVTLKIVSPKFSNFFRYPWARMTGGFLPRLCGVPGFDGVLIHVGNRPEDTDGCLLVGGNTVKGQLTASAATFQKLWIAVKAADVRGEQITIDIA